MKIQKANATDLYDITDLAHQGKLSHFYEMTNPDYASWLDEWADNLYHGQGEILVAKKNDNLIGAIGWTWGRDLYDQDVSVAQEQFWFVLKEYESSRLGTRLLEEFLLHVEDLGMDAEMTIGPQTSPRVIWLLERYGFGMEQIVMRREFKDE